MDGWMDGCPCCSIIFFPMQYFVRTADSDVEHCLNHFTFLPVWEIQQLVAQHKVQ